MHSARGSSSASQSRKAVGCQKPSKQHAARCGGAELRLRLVPSALAALAHPRWWWSSLVRSACGSSGRRAPDQHLVLRSSSLGCHSTGHFWEPPPPPVAHGCTRVRKTPRSNVPHGQWHSAPRAPPIRPCREVQPRTANRGAAGSRQATTRKAANVPSVDRSAPASPPKGVHPLELSLTPTQGGVARGARTPPGRARAGEAHKRASKRGFSTRRHLVHARPAPNKTSA